jgi:PKD repeat protein
MRCVRYRWSIHKENIDKEMISKTGVRKAKIDKHTIGGADKNKELIFIFFGLCVAAILLFASTSVASASNSMPTDCYSFTIESAPNAPVSDPNGPYRGTEGVSTTFNGSGSYDPDGRIVAYEWDFGDGNTAIGVAPTHSYAKNGTYNVTLTVTDNDGATNTNTTTATIADTEPTADFSPLPTSGQEPLTVNFTDKTTSHDGIEAWNWDFNNDGVIESKEQNPTYVYAEEGIYTVSLTVTESDGDSDTVTKADYITVTKINSAPYAPDNPSPSDGATDVSLDAVLSWTGGDPDADGTVTYHVYFGTSINLPLVAENLPENSYDPGTLDYSTGYYWQIVATDDHGAVTVTDDTEIDTVTIDLSPIGGSDEAQMNKIPGTDRWTITTNAVEGINHDHDLIVTATDTSGNSDSSVSIQLTVLRRGDVDHDNDVDAEDALAIQEYIEGHAPSPGVFLGDVYPATGDNAVDLLDAEYIFVYAIGYYDEP